MRIEIAQIRLFWRRITRTRYARALETDLARAYSENSRLRDENRALLNSILGIAGIPPVYTNSAEQPRSSPSPRAGSDAPAPTTPADTDYPLRTPVTEPVSPPVANLAAAGALPVRALAERGKNSAQLAPLRRRSWHQVNRALEFKAALKRPQESTQE